MCFFIFKCSAICISRRQSFIHNLWVEEFAFKSSDGDSIQRLGFEENFCTNACVVHPTHRCCNDIYVYRTTNYAFYITSCFDIP
uniref:Uncharacterized protein n=1 Tax=Kalanchoe fedtschenkoi TaxID=63787 RepID=A0A7N0TKP2_KALFE